MTTFARQVDMFVPSAVHAVRTEGDNLNLLAVR